ncbi:tubulin monoglycylase TTLL3 isoform X2 [Poecile atricapillus]|uniref:tubulin monoglycylase TTLL3 isoform X2 n=1 Tax=Poecile atricapillus TaxID=48891 RepID=UPI00273A1C5F|nr:tubulin monoglycylase TTLL3 isoform X2 [Poecile atricapillus]
MGQCDTESSTPGTPRPRQGWHLSRVHSSHPTAQQAGDKGTVWHPGTVRCSWDIGTRLSRAVAVPVGLGTVGSDKAVLTGHSAATTRHQVGHQHLLNLEQLKKAKLHVEMAIKEKKIFTVQGPYPIIRRLMRARGWVERKVPSTGRRMVKHRGDQDKQRQETGPSNGGGGQEEALLNPGGGAQPFVGTKHPLHYPWRPTEEEEEKEEEQCDEDPNGIHDLMSYLVRDQLPNFIWTNYLEATDHQLLQHDNVVNHYARVDAFTTKEGLCLSLQNLPWIEQADPNTFFPRCYRLGNVDELETFIEDFRLTAARSLLKLALEEAGDRPVGTEQVPNNAKGAAWPASPLYPELVEEALEICRQHLGVLQHQDIDRNTPSPCRTCIDWDRFLQEYYHVAHKGAGLVLTQQQRKQCQNLLWHLAQQLPQLDMEGKLNVWILKPGAESQGRGIVCTTQLEEVLQLARSCMAPSVQVGRWVVQKYVERLLTIFGTKFDIRQWFVVTDWKPLTVWFYRDCYLRFCSQPFSLCHLERARHLCNVSVQKWYKTSPDQDPRVPPDRIWSNEQFQKYLAQLGQADAWHQMLVPGMKAAILNTLRSAQHQVRFRKGSFELYGADFIVGEDFQPWLLEINSSPTMSPSSAVTRRLCANVQRDTLRLVLDRKDNPTCPIGAFELIYKEAAVPKPLSTCVKLMVKGCSLKKLQPAQQQDQNKPPTTVATALHHPVSPGASATHVPKKAQHQFLTMVPCVPKLLLSPGVRTTKAPQRTWHRSPTMMPTASKRSVLPGGRTTEVTQSRAATKKLPPLEQRNHCSSSSSDPPAPPKPQVSSAESQGLPWLSCLPGQPQAAQPRINGCPINWVPVPPPRGTPSNPWPSQGCARSFRPAKPQQQPPSAQSTKTLCLEQKHTATPTGMRKTWNTKTPPGVDRAPPVLC